MKRTRLMTSFAAAALMVAGSAFACPKNDKDRSPGQDGADEGVYEVIKRGGCDKDKGARDEGVYEVADREGDEKAERGERERRRDRGDRARRGDRGERAERGERGERRERGRRGGLMRGLDLTEDQRAQVKEIVSAAREEAKAVMSRVKEARENGDEVDREAVRERLMAIRKDAMKKVYNTVLTEAQQAKVDERRKRMEERRKERRERGERGERRGKDRDGERGERRERGADKDDLDL